MNCPSNLVEDLFARAFSFTLRVYIDGTVKLYIVA